MSFVSCLLGIFVFTSPLHYVTKGRPPAGYATEARVTVRRIGITKFQHAVVVRNASEKMSIISVVAAGYDGFAQAPVSVTTPVGWYAKIVEGYIDGRRKWVVELTCDPSTWPDEIAPASNRGASVCRDADGATHAVQPSEALSFEIVLRYESAALGSGVLRLVFADGQVVETLAH